MKLKTWSLNVLKLSIILIVFILGDTALNFTLYNPQFVTPIYNFLLQRKILSSEMGGYPIISLKTINRGEYSGPRALVEGIVTEVVHSQDGDIHINISHNNDTLVAEIIPEYPLPIPKIGDIIQIWGVTRYDIAHRWWEIHPVIGWKKLK